MAKLIKRKKILIYPRFQLLLIGVNILVTACTFGITIFQASQTFSRFQELGKMVQLPQDHSFFNLIEFQASTLHSKMIVSFFISIVLSAIMTLVISHRLSGPIVRLKSYFSEIAEKKGLSSQLHFRKGDFFADLPEVINRALQSLKSKN